MVTTETTPYAVPGVGRGYMDTNTVVQCNQSNPSEWLFYGRQYESRTDMMNRLAGVRYTIPSTGTPTTGATTTTTEPEATEDKRKEFKRKETSFWNIIDNVASVFCPSDEKDYKGMTPEKKKELEEAREAGRSTFWKNVLWGAVKAVVATVVIGAALAATGITFGAAAPLLVVAGVAVAAYMTMDAMQKKNDAEERLTEAVVQGDTQRLNTVVTKDMAASGDEFGTGVVGLGLGLYAGARNVIPAGRNVATTGANCFRGPTTRVAAVTSPTTPPPSTGTWRAAMVEGAYPTSHNAALGQLPLAGIQTLTTESVAVRNFNERNGIVTGQTGVGQPPMRQGGDISCSYGTMT